MHSLNQEHDILDRTFRFAVRITKLCVFLDSRAGTGRVLNSQLVRAGTSVGSQVEEAQAAESTADFISKLSVGLKEARETHYRLRRPHQSQLALHSSAPPLVLHFEF